MNAEIRDTTVLRAVRSTDVSAYLRARGWNLAKQNERGSLWDSEHDWEILLPLDNALLDYASRIAEVLDTLSRKEHRSPLEVLADIGQVSADVIRVVAPGTGTADGSISLPEGAGLIEGAREMMLAAACATIDPRVAYPGRKPEEAVEYLKRVRMGQTERGSYVVTLLSRLPPPLEIGPENPLLAHPLAAEEPFERKVTATLFRATKAVKTAARSVMNNQDFNAFTAAVYDGVSANFCDALSQMSGVATSPIRIGFSWSPTRPAPGDSSSVDMSAEDVEVIREAARVFKQTAAQEDYPVVGTVVKLARGEEARDGQVTIFSHIEGRPHGVTVDLPHDDYVIAVDAHKEHKIVRCFGTLAREGRSFKLQRPHGFSVIPDLEQAPLLEP